MSSKPNVTMPFLNPNVAGSGQAMQRASDSKEFTTDKPELIGTGAIKYDAGKPSVWRGVINYFPRALWQVAEISTFGAKKYSWAGWEGVEEGFERYKDAQFRHALKQAMGETDDGDSKLLHLAHEAWGALATLELHLRKLEEANEAVEFEKLLADPAFGKVI